MNNGNWIDLKQDAESGIETIRAHFQGHAYDPQQLVNPKTWMMALAAVSVFAGGEADHGMRVVCLSLLFLLIAIPCMSAWVWLGISAARLCSSAIALQRFNRCMTLLLLVSAWMTLWI